MENQKRRFERIKPDTRYTVRTLMQHNGIIYNAQIEDISYSGAFIRIPDGVPQDLNVGDKCYFVSLSEYDSSSTNRLCKVIRRDSECMGLDFLS